jgi:hypothetical protein
VRWRALALFACGCDASVTDTVDAPPVIEDTTQMTIACPQDPGLLICMSFDAVGWTSPYNNEGALAMTADLTAVTRTMAGEGGSALLGPTSEILFPIHPELVGFAAMDVRLRFDADVPPGGRVGIIDSDSSTPGMSLFVYTGTTSSHRIRCNLGGVDLYAATTITLGAFTEIACTCNMGNVAVHQDGVKLVELAGTTTCTPGSATNAGLQIGQNSRADDALPPNEQFVGAIDRVRLWNRVP